MKKYTDPRHQSRIIALQKIFSNHFSQGNDKVSGMDLKDIAETDKIKEYDKDLAQKIINGIEDNLQELDKIIEENAPQWPAEQIQKVDLEILRIGIWEGFIGKITPPKVAIDEAIEIAKEFGGETSSKFVNGVMGAIYENKGDSPKTQPDANSQKQNPK